MEESRKEKAVFFRKREGGKEENPIKSFYMDGKIHFIVKL